MPTRPSIKVFACMFPAEFLERLQHIVPAGKYEKVLLAMNTPGATSFRINTLRAGRDDVLARLQRSEIPVHPISWNEAALWVSHEHRDRLLRTALYAEGHIYVQNQASMVPPLALEPHPGERVLDLTAAPGSKTLQLACMMREEGELAAVEVVKSRFFKLRDNLAAQGATRVRTFLKDGRAVWKNRPEYFDRVLLDAPCSSEGRFHSTKPESYAYWSLRKIKEMAHKQKRLLYSAIQCLRPGGTLVYSTCSFSPEENEAIVSGALARFGPALEVVALPGRLGPFEPALHAWRGRSFHPDLSRAGRILPDYWMDGFFICKIAKKESTLP